MNNLATERQLIDLLAIMGKQLKRVFSSGVDGPRLTSERTLRILSLFQEKESRDELGFGSVRDCFADQLFPGTSAIQTRLRAP